MSDGPVFEYDESVIGVEVEVGSVEITPELVSTYCDLIGETNPLYTDEGTAAAGPYGAITAPPSLLQRMRFREGPDPKVRFGNTSMHAGTRMEQLGPVRVGDVLTAHAQAKEVFAKTGRSGTMVFAVRRTTYRNQDGEVVVHLDQTTAHREVSK
jgi:acyl dehydratase